MNTVSVRKQTSFRLSEDLLSRLQEEAKRHNRSLNNLVESVKWLLLRNVLIKSRKPQCERLKKITILKLSTSRTSAVLLIRYDMTLYSYDGIKL